MSVIDEQGAFVLQKDDEDALRIAARAYREPVLRGFFPYTNLSNLKFSKKSRVSL